MKNPKADYIIFIYSNQPIIRYRGLYYSRFNNFIDFLCELSKLDKSYHLIVPCKKTDTISIEEVVQLNPPERLIEMSYYKGGQDNFRGHLMAFITSLRNAIRCSFIVKGAKDKGRKVMIIGPGPNSFLFWLSCVFNRSIFYAFFIRGDTLKTLEYIYADHPFSIIITGMVRVFHRRILSLVNQSRALVFCFGEKLLDLYPGPEAYIHVIRPIIDRGLIRVDERKDIEQDKALKVLYVGRLSREKNVMTLIDACEAAYAHNSPFYLTIIGDGPLYKEIVSHVKYSQLSQYITLTGYISHGKALIQQYDSHDLLCLPSYTESISRVVVEAFARAMPVIATPVGSLPSFFKQEILFTKGYGADDMVDKILWANTHRKDISEMGRKGQRLVKSFIIQDNALRVKEIIEGFLRDADKQEGSCKQG